MHIAALVSVVAIVVGFAVPASADDRPSDPFGNHTIELKEVLLLKSGVRLEANYRTISSALSLALNLAIMMAAEIASSAIGTLRRPNATNIAACSDPWI